MGKNSNMKNTVYYYPSVTVIVCTYNSENTVEKTIDSLLKLNYPNDKLEIILMDDGSLDLQRQRIWRLAKMILRIPSVK